MLGTALPLAEAIVSFFNSLVQKIPFGIGDEIRRAINALIDLVRAIPTTVDALLNQLLKPLRDMFFPGTGDPVVKLNLFDPITQNLLTPLKKFLTDVENLIDRWEKDFAKPVQDALDQRAKVRKQIAALRKDIGLVLDQKSFAGWEGSRAARNAQRGWAAPLRNYFGESLGVQPQNPAGSESSEVSET